MSQQVLARKWRPRRFADLIGQDHVRKALSHALESNRLHHAYLFTGTRGVGKTTIARILARCLNCEQGVTSTPCGTCHACEAIEAGRFIDLIEVDAASRTKVDDTRELLENVSYAPNQGRYKVYLIDEVHMLTTHSFNALLKTLEEPPAHVVFLLATTDPQKVLPTVLSRCLQFHLRDLAPDLVASHLATVLTGESIAFDEEALWHLAKAGRGSVRDAMTLLDQAIAFGEGSVQTDDVIAMLGQQGQSDIPALLGHVASGDAGEVLAQIRGLAQMAPDWLSCLTTVQECLHQIAVAQADLRAIQHLPPGARDQITAMAQAMHPEFVQLAYQFALHGYRDLPLTPDPRSGFEMVLLRMLAFRPARAREYPAATAQPMAVTPADSEDHPRPVAEPPLPAQSPVEVINQSPEDQSSPTAAIDDATPPWDLVPAVSPAPEHASSTPPVPFALAIEDLASADTHSDETSTESDRADPELREPAVWVNPENWAAIFDALSLHGMTGSFASQMALMTQMGSRWTFATGPEIHRLITEVHRHRIETALRQATQQDIQIEILSASELPETPLGRRERLAAEERAAAQQAFCADPVVKGLVTRFNAAIDQYSIQPLGKEI